MSPIEMPSNIQLVEKRETRTSRGMLSKGWYRVDGQLVMVKGTDGDREGKLPLDIHAPPAGVRDPGRVRLGGPGSDSQKEKEFLQGRVLHLR